MSCNNCHNLEKKLKIYEQFVSALKETDEEDLHQCILDESIVIGKNNDGNFEKKIKSNLSESILIVDKGKKLDELSKIEQKSIKEQDNLAAYQNTIDYSQKGVTIYTVGYYTVTIAGSIIKFALFL